MYRLLFFLIVLLCAASPAVGQSDWRQQIGDTLNSIANRELWVGHVALRNVSVNRRARTVTVTAGESLGYLPLREGHVREIYAAIRSLLPEAYQGYTIHCRTNGYDIEELVPNLYRTGKTDSRRQFKTQERRHTPTPLLTNVSRPYRPTRGLTGRHIALWQSHGLHYDQSLARWEWQRARLLTTVEDLYTQAYVLPFLVPMLENAGANVLLPRERDTQLHEVIVDNDHSERDSRYTEHNGGKSWETGAEAGFAHRRDCYLHGENPFAMGTYRLCATTRDRHETATTEWRPDLPEAGRYAVYVSYKTLPNSTEHARYAVYHKGGVTRFEVNQRMYGGTWLYLGHFDFAQGSSELGRVVLDNYSGRKGETVTADAVKFGGGMGNIARQPAVADTLTVCRDNTPADTVIYRPSPLYTPETSGYPRFTEGARYWLQWAGAPDSVYSRTRGGNDYLDDFQSRGFWVNYISGGSAVAPREEGLHVPVDLSIGFHTDAGTTGNDSIIGTLAICTTRNTDKEPDYANGVSRLAARDLADIVQTQIVSDLRLTHAPEWVRRGLWDKSYSESRVPEVPAMLLELLSHQNFADMCYGLDPAFRFTVCRAIYKGLLKYFQSVYDTPYTVQPLPVEAFSIRFTAHDEVELHWLPTDDPLEPTAQARQYVVYMQMDDTGFDNGYLLDDNRCRFRLEPDHIYSFKVSAVNEGGESFPSETLSVCRSSQDRGEVLIVNGFDRVGAPAGFAIDSTYAGFPLREDAGVPYLHDIAFVGEQYEFRRDIPWSDDDAPGFGASHGTWEGQVVAGNTFDYPALHGRAIARAGYSFTSCSRAALTRGTVSPGDYPVVDLILGKQRETYTGRGQSAPKFKTFPLDLQRQIEAYCREGGRLLVSGSKAATDLYHGSDTTGVDRRFLTEVLRCRLRNPHGSQGGRVRVVQSPAGVFTPGTLSYHDRPNPQSYYVESPDAIEPADPGGHTICRYADNNLSAGIVCDTGVYRLCMLGFPFETIRDETRRDRLMQEILAYLLAPPTKSD